MPALAPLPVLLATAGILLSSGAASAQQQSTPVQIAGEFSTLGLDRPDDGKGVSGIGVRLDVGLTRRLEVESRLTWFPSDALTERQAQGGRTLQFAVGVRGKFIVSRRASLYGVLLPGLLHFSNTVISTTGQTATGGATHFALDTGLGVELYPESRWTVRGEVTGPLYGAPGAELARSAPNANGAFSLLIAEARFVNPWQISAAIGYRPGALREVRREEPVAGRWEIGGSVSQTTAVDAGSFSATSFRTTPALGAFVSYRLAPGVYADVALNAFVRRVLEVTPFDGGYLLQGLGGVKLGLRQDHYGFFVKARAGVNSHSGALAAFDTSIPSVTTSRWNAVAVDLGGVFERYVGRRLLIRFDGGDVLSVFRTKTITLDGQSVPVDVPGVTHGPQMGAGVGWRF